MKIANNQSESLAKLKGLVSNFSQEMSQIKIAQNNILQQIRQGKDHKQIRELRNKLNER